MTLPLLQLVGLTKRFGLVMANDDISLEVNRGEIHCLLGENGAGKTTLAECIYGYYKPDAGEIRYQGKPVRLSSPSDALRLGIGMVHQHFVLIRPHSVIENVVLGAEEPGLLSDYTGPKKKLLALCRTYGLDLDLDAKVWQLSVGEQQWVEILKALYVGAELLILDEPTAVLTPQEADGLFTVLSRMKDEGKSIIFITHKLKEVMKASDRVTVLRKGKHVATVDTKDVTMEDLARMMVGRDLVFRVEKETRSHGEPVLQVQELCAWGDHGREVVDNVSLTLHEREILGIAGVAGNGQRELAEVLVGSRPVKSGRILLADRDISGSGTKEIMACGMGFIPQDRIMEGLVPGFSVAENLILGFQDAAPYSRHGILNSRAIREFAERSIDDFEIATPSTSHKTSYLSGGNLQRVILARELSHEPKALVANQPTRGLDVSAIEYVHRRLLDQAARGTGILLFSEDLDEILALSDRIAVMHRGKIVGLFDATEATREAIGLCMTGVVEGRS